MWLVLLFLTTQKTKSSSVHFFDYFFHYFCPQRTAVKWFVRFCRCQWYRSTSVAACCAAQKNRKRKEGRDKKWNSDHFKKIDLTDVWSWFWTRFKLLWSAPEAKNTLTLVTPEKKEGTKSTVKEYKSWLEATVAGTWSCTQTREAAHRRCQTTSPCLASAVKCPNWANLAQIWSLSTRIKKRVFHILCKLI